MFHNVFNTTNEKSKLIGRLSNFTNPFILPCAAQVTVVDDVLISPTCAMLSRENFLQNRMVDTDAIYGHNTGRTLQS